MKIVVQGFRSFLFYPVYTLIVVFFSLVSCTVGLLMPLRLRQEVVTWGNWLIIHWLNLCCGIRVRVIGRENLPTTPFVALSNHQSSWETYYLQRTLRPVSTILKRELLRIPIFGWGLAAVKPIAIDRNNPRQALKEVLSQGKARLTQGNNVIVYPEGTRTPFGKTGNYGRSGAALAIAASVPVVPVAHNAGKYWPAHKFLKYPGTITVVFGSPIDTTGMDSKDLGQVVEGWITKTQREIG